MSDISNNNMKPVAIYGRVSTQNQESQETIKNQLMAIEEFLKDKNYTVVKKYLDEGWSGTILERPALDQLRNDARNFIRGSSYSSVASFSGRSEITAAIRYSPGPPSKPRFAASSASSRRKVEINRNA